MINVPAVTDWVPANLSSSRSTIIGGGGAGVLIPLFRGKDIEGRPSISENYAKCVHTLGYNVTKPFHTLFASEARPASGLLRFIMILAQVNLVYAVTPL